MATIGEEAVQGRASWKSVTGGTCKEKSMAATATATVAAAAAAGIRRGNSVQVATAPLSQLEFRLPSHPSISQQASLDSDLVTFLTISRYLPFDSDWASRASKPNYPSLRYFLFDFHPS